MPLLEKRVSRMLEDRDSKSNFMLFLTSKPTGVPASILQSSLKVTIESPKDLKPNLSKCLEFTSLIDSKHPSWWRLAYGVMFFHAAVQLRNKFGPLGWNISYDFSSSDFETSIVILKDSIESSPEVPWEQIRYFIGEVNYGGRIIDEVDRRTLNQLLLNMFNEDTLATPQKYFPVKLNSVE